MAEDTSEELGALATRAGIRHLHIVAWRDLADVEAGGSEVYIARLAERYAAAGMEVFVRTSYAQGHRPRGERDGYELLRRAGRNMVFPTTILEEATRRHGPIDGLIEVWNGVPYFSPVWYRGPNAVILHHVHQEMWDLVLESPQLARIGRFLEARVAPLFYRGTEVITDSASSRAEIVEVLRLAPERVSVAPPGIDDRYRPGPEKSPTPLVVAVGRLMPSKRFDELVRVVAACKPDHPDLELVIVGDGYERENLLEQIAELGAQDWIHLPGFVQDDELLSLYQRAWTVASASMAEGWGMTLTEAAACGTPAVASRISGHVDAVADGTSGLLADDSAAMVRHLDAVLGDRALRERLSAGAIEHASRLTWDATARLIFERLLVRRSGRGGGHL